VIGGLSAALTVAGASAALAGETASGDLGVTAACWLDDETSAWRLDNTGDASMFYLLGAVPSGPWTGGQAPAGVSHAVLGGGDRSLGVTAELDFVDGERVRRTAQASIGPEVDRCEYGVRFEFRFVDATGALVAAPDPFSAVVATRLDSGRSRSALFCAAEGCEGEVRAFFSERVELGVVGVSVGTVAGELGPIDVEPTLDEPLVTHTIVVRLATELEPGGDSATTTTTAGPTTTLAPPVEERNE